MIRICLLFVTLATCLEARSKADAAHGLFEEYRNGPGCAYVVTKAGRVILAGSSGYANLDRSDPIAPATLFNLASVSKQFTAAVIVALASKKKLLLDDSVRKYIPSLPAYAEPVTIHQLLNHRSGIRDVGSLFEIAGRNEEALSDQLLLETLSRQQTLNFPAGSQFLYSNTGYALLGLIAAKAGGRPLPVLAKELVFDQAGMKTARFAPDPNSMTAGRAIGYLKGKNGAFVPNRISVHTMGDGGMFASVLDVAAWHKWFGKDPAVQARLRGNDQIGYEFGLWKGHWRGLDVLEHGGEIGGYRSYSGWFPNERIGVACLCNRAGVNAYELAMKMAAHVFGDRLKPAQSKVSNVPDGIYQAALTRRVAKVRGGKITMGESAYDLDAIASGASFRWTPPGEEEQVWEQIEPPKEVPFSAYSGNFHNDETGQTFFFEKEGDHLVLRTQTGWRLPLEAVAPHRFIVGPWVLEFGQNLRLTTTRTRNLYFVRTP